MSGTDERILSVNLRQHLLRALKPDEKLVWVAQPDPHRDQSQELAGPIAGMLALFSIFFILMFHNSGSYFSSEHLMVWGGGGIGLLAATLMIVVPRATRNRYKRTVYAVTTQRALIIEARPDSNDMIRSFLGGAMPRITREENADGSGNLYLSSESIPVDGNDVTVSRKVGFVGIAKVREVESLIRLTLRDVPR